MAVAAARAKDKADAAKALHEMQPSTSTDDYSQKEVPKFHIQASYRWRAQPIATIGFKGRHFAARCPQTKFNFTKYIPLFSSVFCALQRHSKFILLDPA